MAAAKPIVTTPIRDVVEPYGRWVEVAPDAEAFVASCERLLAEEPHARAERVRGMLAFVAHTSWDDTAREMLQELREAEASLEERERQRPFAERPPLAAVGS
jgi:glycosyltransferase involved in cell wall biosynthesis